MSGTTLLHSPSRRGARGTKVAPLLECGARMNARDFMRAYETMDEDIKAELIGGVVYIMNQFVSPQWHGEPDSILQTWIGTYAFSTLGVKSTNNTTLELTPDDLVQPDGLLRVLPEFGGACRHERKQLIGPPEFVYEVAFSSKAIDRNEKKETYRRGRVAEYLLWCTDSNKLDWWQLEKGEYQPLSASSDGILRSGIFPGLWLDAKALLSDNGARVLAVLNKGLKSAEHASFAKRLKAKRRTGG